MLFFSLLLLDSTAHEEYARMIVRFLFFLLLWPIVSF